MNLIFFKKLYCCVHYWKKFMDNFFIFSFGQIINNIWMIKFEVFCNVQMKYGLNRINTKVFTQQVGWFGGKGIELHSWGPKSNFTNDICCGQH
jgi:hypothetical protein